MGAFDNSAEVKEASHLQKTADLVKNGGFVQQPCWSNSRACDDALLDGNLSDDMKDQ